MILSVWYQNKDGTKSTRAKTWMIMKLTIILMCFFTFQVSAKTDAQRITIVRNSISLSDVFKHIEQQTGYHFFYDRLLLKNTHPVDIAIRSVTLDQALSTCLKGQSLTYSIVMNTVVISRERMMHGQVQTVSAPLLEPLPPPIEIDGNT